MPLAILVGYNARVSATRAKHPRISHQSTSSLPARLTRAGLHRDEVVRAELFTIRGVLVLSLDVFQNDTLCKLI